jgi:hypothetical protein
LAQHIGAHVAAIQASKQPLRLDDIYLFLDQVTAQKDGNSENMPPWELIGMFISKLSSEVGSIAPFLRNIVKSGQVISSESTTTTTDMLLIAISGPAATMGGPNGCHQGFRLFQCRN